jgi:hypothetical protein
MDDQQHSALPAPATQGDVVARFYVPQERLQPYVTFFYFVEAIGPLTDFLYPEWGNVRFAAAGRWHVDMPGFPDPVPQTAVLFGPTDRHGRIETSGGTTFGFGLTPIGWHRLVNDNAGAMANRVVPLGGRLGMDGETLRARLVADADDTARVVRLEQLLLARLEVRPPVNAAVLAADQALRTRPAKAPAFARAAGLSELQGFLERGFAAFDELGGAGEFLGAIGQRERLASSRLFAGDPDPFGDGVSRTPRRGSAGSRARSDP